MTGISRAMALDIGSVRVGVAVSDPMRITANGVETYKRTGDDETDAKYLAGLANQYAPVTLFWPSAEHERHLWTPGGKNQGIRENRREAF